jgi:hypothetical protein
MLKWQQICRREHPFQSCIYREKDGANGFGSDLSPKGHMLEAWSPSLEY